MKIACAGLASVLALNGCTIARAIQVPTLAERTQAHCALEVDSTCSAQKDPAIVNAQFNAGASIAAAAVEAALYPNSEADAKGAADVKRAEFMELAYGSKSATWWHIDYRNASAFCANVVEYGKKARLQRRALGWTTALVGAAGTALLTGYATEEAHGGKEAAAFGAAVAGTALVTLLGAALIQRGNAASKAVFAAQAAKRSAEDNDNDKLWEKCIDIRTEWAADDASAAEGPSP